VEDIVDSRVVDGKTEYLVKWKDVGDDSQEQTWEPAANLEGAPDVVRRYEERRKQQQQPPRRAAESTADTPAEAPSAAAATEAAVGCKRRGESQEPAAADPISDPSTWLRVHKIIKPSGEGGEVSYMVRCSDDTQAAVSREQLRAHAPLLLVDFLEARLVFDK